MTCMNMEQRVELIQSVLAAKRSHVQWVNRAIGLIEGVPLGGDHAPVAHTDCAFGNWYYHIAPTWLGHLKAFQAIEPAHRQLHERYAEIVALLHPETKGWWQKSLMGLIQEMVMRPDPEEIRREVVALREQMRQASDLLQNQLDTLRIAILDMNTDA